MPAGATARAIDPADYERYVAFAFAAADLVVEIGPDQRAVYAAGAFRAHLGRDAENYLCRPVTELIAPIDHELLETSLAALNGSGRLQRCVVRLANNGRTCVALSGLALPSRDGVRLCLGFSLLPSPLDEAARISPGSLLRRAESYLRARDGRLELLQIVGDDGANISLNGPLNAVLRSILPSALAADLSPGRIGIIDDGAGRGTDVASCLAEMLRAKGVKASIVSHHLALADHDLTPVQAARALRHAIGVFARDGTVGLHRSGFSDGLSGHLAQASLQAADLRRLIRDESFDLVYQPIVTLADRELDHYEALIRPHRSTAASRTPQDFVMMVETVGMAEELDRAVARRACEAASVSGRGIAINLSSQSVQSPAFRRELVELLQLHRAAERRISVEMTETAEIDDLDEAARTANDLRRIGVPFALDDFGAGKAGIDVLRALEPEIVKFDGSYTEGVAKSARDRALFAGMADLVRASGASIVAERVETEREAAELPGLGVRFGQGWLFGRAGPLPLHAQTAEPARSNARRRQGAPEMWGFRQR